MAISFGTNIASLKAIRRVNQAGESLRNTLEQLGSGMRINRASDDAAGLAVSSQLNAQARVYSQAVRNLSDGVSVLSIAEQTLGELTSIVERQIELAQQASNGVFSSVQRTALEEEALALAAEYNRILESTEFNEIAVLNPALSRLQLQAGYGEDGILSINLLTDIAAGISSVTENFTMSSVTQAPLSYVKFLKIAGDDGKDTLVAMGFGSLAGNAVVGIRTYRVNGAGNLTLSGVEYLGAGMAIGDVIAASFIANFTGSTLRIQLNLDDGNAPIQVNRQFNVQSNGAVVSLGAGFGGGDASTTSIIGNFSGTSATEQASTTTVANGVNPGRDFTVTYNKGSSGSHPLSLPAFRLQTQSSAQLALDVLSLHLNKLGQVSGNIGAGQSRIGVALAVLNSTKEQVTAAESRIKDVDVASASANAVRQAILQDTATAILAQANAQPQFLLALLGVQSNS